MVTTQRSRRGGLFWAILGGLVLIAGIVAIIVVPLAGQPSPTATPTPATTSASGSPTPPGSAGGEGEFVDPSVTAKGWVPEPITTDPRDLHPRRTGGGIHLRHQKSTRDEWLTYLDTWFTPDTRYTAEADQRRADAGVAAGVATGGRSPAGGVGFARRPRTVASSAVVTGDIVFVPVTEDPSGDMSIGTGRRHADVHPLRRQWRRDVVRRERARERAGAVRGGVGPDPEHGAASRGLQGGPLLHGAVGALTWVPRWSPPQPSPTRGLAGRS